MKAYDSSSEHKAAVNRQHVQISLGLRGSTDISARVAYEEILRHEPPLEAHQQMQRQFEEYFKERFARCIR